MFELLIRDYAGGKMTLCFHTSDTLTQHTGFPVRHANFVRGNNNESTSEALTLTVPWHSIALSSSLEIMERGLYLHASTSAVWEYWNDIDGFKGDDPIASNFPPPIHVSLPQLFGVMAVLFPHGSVQRLHILGIQGLPSNPLTMRWTPS